MPSKTTIQSSEYHSLTPGALVRCLVSMTKPGIIGGNIITALAGFSFGVQQTLKLTDLFATMAGIVFIIASAGVVNNFIDRDIDRLMSRTQHRASLYTSLSPFYIMLYALCLLTAGSLALYLFTNTLATTVALTGFFIYIVPYTLWLKRRSHWSTLVGSFAGATPPVIAYCAATNLFDHNAIFLFIVLLTWQMPHFMAISLYRSYDFKAAAIPTLPQVKGSAYTQYSILFWITLFLITLCLPFLNGRLHSIPFIIMIITGSFWLGYGLYNTMAYMSVKSWGRGMFLISLVVIFIISGLLCFEALWR